MINWAHLVKAAIAQAGQVGTAKTDETSISSLLAVSSVPTSDLLATTKLLSSVLAVPSPTFLEKHDCSIPVSDDSDRWCYPRSSALNGAEIGAFEARLRKCSEKGLARNDGEVLADRLVVRDRESDNRQVCFECGHFAGYGVGSWRCGNYQPADIAIHSRHAQLPLVLVMQLQRCNGFATPPRSKLFTESEAHRQD
jgi:hypothetical protein